MGPVMSSTTVTPDRTIEHSLEGAVAGGRRVIRLGGWVIAVFFGLGGGWLALAPLNGAVIADGTLIVGAYRKTVQHQEGGIVKAILVKEGDHVAQGQPLLTLAEIQASSSTEILQGQLDGELLRAARLAAERTRNDRFAVPKAVAERAKANSSLAALVAAERQLFETRREQLRGQVSVLKTQVIQVREEAAALEERYQTALKSAGLIGEELAMSEELRARNFVQKTQVIGLKRSMSEKEEQRGEFKAQIAQAKQKATDIELRILGLFDAYMRDAADELKDVNRRILDLQERIRPNADVLDRLVVRAPVSGEVVDLRVTTVGGVVGAREMLAEILPDNTGLIVEAKVRIADIAHIKAGDPVEVQLSAYQQRVTPLIKGRMVYISADSLVESVNGAPASYYKAQAVIDPVALKAAGSPPLLPGMPAVLFIQTRTRTALEYLVEPVTDVWRQAFREY